MLRWTPVIHALGLISDPGHATLTVRFPDRTTGTVAVESVADPRANLTDPRPAGWISLPGTAGAPMPLYLRNSDTPYWFEYLPAEAVVYFQFNGVGDQPLEPIAAFCERLFTFIDNHQVSKLVIDLRWNGGGNTYLVQPLLHRLIGCTKINQRGCLYVIIGRGMFSAAQNTATAIERETNAIFAGEPTGSRPNFIGETIPFTLPYSKTLVNVADGPEVRVSLLTDVSEVIAPGETEVWSEVICARLAELRPALYGGLDPVLRASSMNSRMASPHSERARQVARMSLRRRSLS